MDITLDLILCAAASLFLALPLSCVCLWRSRGTSKLRLLGWAAMLLSIAGIFLGFATFGHIVSARHFVMKN